MQRESLYRSPVQSLFPLLQPFRESRSHHLQRCERYRRQYLDDYLLPHVSVLQSCELAPRSDEDLLVHATLRRRRSCLLTKLVLYKYLMSLCHDEYVVRGFATLSEKLAFQLHQYFDQLNVLALISQDRSEQLRNLHVDHQIPLAHQSVARFRQRYLRPTPLVPSARSMPVDQLQQLPTHSLNVRTQQKMCNQ